MNLSDFSNQANHFGSAIVLWTLAAAGEVFDRFNHALLFVFGDGSPWPGRIFMLAGVVATYFGVRVGTKVGWWTGKSLLKTGWWGTKTTYAVTRLALASLGSLLYQGLWFLTTAIATFAFMLSWPVVATWDRFTNWRKARAEIRTLRNLSTITFSPPGVDMSGTLKLEGSDGVKVTPLGNALTRINYHTLSDRQPRCGLVRLFIEKRKPRLLPDAVYGDSIEIGEKAETVEMRLAGPMWEKKEWADVACPPQFGDFTKDEMAFMAAELRRLDGEAAMAQAAATKIAEDRVRRQAMEALTADLPKSNDIFAKSIGFDMALGPDSVVQTMVMDALRHMPQGLVTRGVDFRRNYERQIQFAKAYGRQPEPFHGKPQSVTVGQFSLAQAEKPKASDDRPKYEVPENADAEWFKTALVLLDSAYAAEGRTAADLSRDEETKARQRRRAQNRSDNARSVAARALQGSPAGRRTFCSLMRLANIDAPPFYPRKEVHNVLIDDAQDYGQGAVGESYGQMCVESGPAPAKSRSPLVEAFAARGMLGEEFRHV
jgi:hypothetical protein